MKIKHILLLAAIAVSLVFLAQGCASGNGMAPGVHVIFGATS